MRTKDLESHIYSTLDAYVAGFLSLMGNDPRLVDQGGKIAFVFQRTNALRHSLEAYTEGVSVPASAFVFHIKSLKSRIHELRRENGAGLCHRKTAPPV